MSTLPWNLVTKGLHGHELLRKKLAEKIKKLETRMKHYPAGTIHLQIVMERHPRKPLFVARLTLRVPSNILRSEKSASDVIKAFDDAVKALLRELVSLMADLRREIFCNADDSPKYDDPDAQTTDLFDLQRQPTRSGNQGPARRTTDGPG